MAKKSMTVKLEKDMLEDVDNECEGLGCNRTDFIIEAVQEKLQGRTEDPQPKDVPKPTLTRIDEPKEKPRYKVILNENIPKAQVYKVSYDGGKTWIDEPKATFTRIDEPKVTVTRIDEPKPNPKVVINLDDEPEPKKIDNSNKPPIQMIQDINGKLSLFAKRYNI